MTKWKLVLLLASPLAIAACSGGALDSESTEVGPAGRVTDTKTTIQGTSNGRAPIDTGGHIRGVVTASDSGTPLDGAEVQILDGPTSVEPRFTDEDGKYNSGHLDSGTYTVTCSRAGYHHLVLPGEVVTSRNFTEADCALIPTGTVLGVVLDSATHQPVVGATVASGDVSTTTDDTGHYELDEVLLGGATVTASMDNYFDSTGTVILQYSGDTTTLDFNLVPGGMIGGIVDSGGTPLPGATVIISSTQIDNLTMTTGADGSYLTGLLPLGNYGLTCKKLGYATESTVVPVTFATTTMVDCSLPDITTVSGVVTDTNGLPLSGVTVADGAVSTSTDDAGFYLLNEVPTGTSTVVASLTGYLDTDVNVTLATATQDIVQNIVLHPGLIVSRIPTSGIDQQNTTGFPSGTRAFDVDDGTSFAQSDGDASYVQTSTGALTGYHTAGYLNIPTGTTRWIRVNWSARGVNATGTTHVELFNGTTKIAQTANHPVANNVYSNYTDSFNVAVPVSPTSTALRTKVVLNNNTTSGFIRYTIVWLDIAVETAAPPPPPPPTTFVPPPNPNNDPVIGFAGDIACSPDDPQYFNGDGTPLPISGGSWCQEKATSQLVVGQNLAAILTLGDNQYENGELQNFNVSFDSTWGHAKTLLFGTVGNHEYNNNQTTVAGYMNYFCPSTGTRAPFCPATGLPARPFYSFNVGNNWHVVVLDSDCDQAFSGGCGVGSEQEQWLRADLAQDLAAHSGGPRCQIAAWHHPRIATGAHCDDPGYDPLDLYRPFWQALADYGVDIVLNGHDHDYERQPARNVNGDPDPNGIVEIIIGTGGRDLDGFPAANADPDPGGTDCSRLPVVRNRQTFGVGKMILHPTGYDYYYEPIASQVGQAGVVDDRVLGVVCH